MKRRVKGLLCRKESVAERCEGTLKREKEYEENRNDRREERRERFERKER